MSSYNKTLNFHKVRSKAFEAGESIGSCDCLVASRRNEILQKFRIFHSSIDSPTSPLSLNFIKNQSFGAVARSLLQK